MLGYLLVEHVRPAEWIHRGTTEEGSPVGYTVDSEADGGKIVAEYSTENDYFTDANLSKLARDIAHARKLHPHVHELFAFCNRRCGPSAWTHIGNTKKKLSKDSIALKVFDAREIATLIIDALPNEPFILSLTARLPTLSRLRQEWAFTHAIPQQNDYVPRPTTEARVRELISANKFTTITGISGAGKSALAAKIARDLRDTFEIVLWIDATDLSGPDALSAVQTERNSERVNVAGLLRSHDCLLVLDNAKAIKELQRITDTATAATRVVATSQLSAPDGFRLPAMLPAEARSLLALEPACPDELANEIVSRASGHPLTLNLLRGVASNDDLGWEAVRPLLPDLSGIDDDDRGLRLFQRILEHHVDALDRELRFIRYCDVQRIDARLLTAVCGASSHSALARRHFLTADQEHVVRVHDLVLVSITRHYELRSEPGFIAKVETFITQEMKADDPLALQSVSRFHASLFARLLREEAPGSFAFRYAYALSRSPTTSTDILGDPVQLASEAKAEKDVGTAVYAVIETIESHYSLARSLGIDAARAQLRGHLSALDDLGGESLSPELLLSLKHHRAKGMAILGEREKAESAFRSILKTDPGFSAAQLQLVRLLAKRGNHDEALSIAEEVFVSAGKDASSVPTTIVLATFESLARLKNVDVAKVVGAHRELFFGRLREALRARYDQPYRVIAALASALWFKAPELFRQVVGILPARLNTPERDEDRFAWAQTQKYGARALGRESEEWLRMLQAAVASHESMEAPRSFHIVQHAECLVMLDRHEECLQLLDRVPNQDRNEFWQYRRAQALTTIDPTSGLSEIEAALSAVEGNPGREKYRAAFLSQRARLKRELGETFAGQQDLRAAVAVCDDDEHRSELERELDAWVAS